MMKKTEVTQDTRAIGPAKFYNLDNRFSLRFTFKDKPITLKYIPDDIFSVELPEVSVDDLVNESSSKMLKLMIRSTEDGRVETELFDTLLNGVFDIDLSLTNPNKAIWKYLGCSVDKIGFSPLISRKSHANPFNYIVYVNVPVVVYNGDKQIIEFGSSTDKNETKEAEGDSE